MRMIRTLTIAAAVIAALADHSPPRKAAVSSRTRGSGESRPAASPSPTADGKYVQAPIVGVDWLITRTHGGLYISGSETFFSQHTFTLRDPAHGDSGLRAISTQEPAQARRRADGLSGRASSLPSVRRRRLLAGADRDRGSRRRVLDESDQLNVRASR